MCDALETVSLSTTMSVDGCRVKIPAEVKKISVNRDSGESVLHKAARLGYRVSFMFLVQYSIRNLGPPVSLVSRSQSILEGATTFDCQWPVEQARMMLFSRIHKKAEPGFRLKCPIK